MSDAEKLDSLFSWANRMYSDKRFAEVDRVLARLDVPKLTSTLVYGWLSVAWWPVNVGDGEKVPSRVLLHQRVAKVHPKMLSMLRGPAVVKGFFTA